MQSRFHELLDPVLPGPELNVDDFVLLDLHKHYDEDTADLLQRLSIAEASVGSSSSSAFVVYDYICGQDVELNEELVEKEALGTNVPVGLMTDLIIPDTLSSSENGESTQDYDMSDGLSLFSDVSSQASPVSSQDILVNNKIDDRTIDASATSVNDTSNMTTSWVTSLANHFSSFQWNPNVPHEQCNLGIKPEHFADLTLQGELAADMVEDESQTGNDIESMEYCFVDGIDDGGYTYRWYDRYT